MRNLYLEQLKRSLAIVNKNVKIYYIKGPVVIFGLLIPFFLFLSFYIGRNLPPKDLIPGLLGITLFFSATSVGPAIIPWEARSKTLERLISSPIALWAIFLGDVFSSSLFGLLTSLFPIIIGISLSVEILDPLLLVLGIILAVFCFASLSIFLSVPPSDTPATIMMLSSMVKFPLVFISGIFIPVEDLPEWGKIVSSISPLTYFTDLAKQAINGRGYYPTWLNIASLTFFTLIFFTIAIKIHERTLQRRF